jgi:hypothetical protein
LAGWRRRVNVTCLLEGGPVHTIIAGGRSFRFEMHPYCGPVSVGRDGGECKNQPGPRSKFWEAVGLWHEQGRRLDGEGRCVWEYPPPLPPLKLIHMGGRNYLVAPQDEPTAEDRP